MTSQLICFSLYQRPFYIENVNCRQIEIAKNRHIATPTTNQMRKLPGMILVQYEKNPSKTVDCERILRKSLLNTQINKQDCPRTMTRLIKKKTFVIYFQNLSYLRGCFNFA